MLRGITTAMFENPRTERTSFTLATVESSSVDDIRVTSYEHADVDLSDAEAVREAVLRVVAMIGTVREEILPLSDEENIIVAPAVYFGTADDAPEDRYMSALRNAFPDVDVSSDHETAVAHLGELLFRQAEDLEPEIIFRGGRLFSDGTGEVTSRDEKIGALLDRLKTRADAGDERALRRLERFVANEARNEQKSWESHAIPDAGHQLIIYGGGLPEAKACSRFTFVEWFDFKDRYVRESMKYASKPHNMCIKSPNSKQSPPFTDVAATFMADTWDEIHELLTGQCREKRHVEVSYRL